MASPAQQLGRLSAAMFLGMTLWFSATAANAQIAREFDLSSAAVAWLTMAVQGGFVAGTLLSALLNLPDIINPRRLFFVGCWAGGLANAGVTMAPGAVSIVALRFVTGAALACVYPPGMKVAAGWFERNRGTALGILIGALTIGSAFPHLLAAMSAAVPWRVLMLVATALAITGGAIVEQFVSDGPHVARSAPFDPSAAVRVFRERGTRLATFGYLGHMWELYAVWTWVAAFATASLGIAGGVAPSSPRGSAVAFVAIAAGALGSAAAGVFADRIGKARIASWAMVVSGTCCATAGFVFGRAAPILFIFALIWGVAVVADSAQLSALVAQYSPRDHVGTALTIQMCAGFLLTMASIRLLPQVAQATGWQWAFLALVPGPICGVLALRGLKEPLVQAQAGPVS